MTTTLALSFLVPGLAIAGAAAVSIPIIIHILSKRPRKPKEWAAMRFLLAAYRRHRMRTRLEQLLLLLCRCLIVLLLGLALAGPILSALGALGDLTAAGRVIVIVLDDSVTTRAVDPATGKTRFEAMQATANKLIDSMGQGDRVALVTTSLPAAAVVSPPTNDPGSVRTRITQHEPSHAKADMIGALRLAQSSIEELEDTPRAIYVAVLSDFAQGSTPIDQQLPEQLKKLGEMATLLRPDPAGSLANVQIESLRPDRKAVIRQTADTLATVTWNVRLRRFTEGAPAGELTGVRLTVPQVAPESRTITWNAGETVREIRIDTPLTETGELGAEAVIDQPPLNADALEADNTRRALVRVRQKLTVVIVDEPGPDTGELTARKWLTVALAPVADTWSWPIEIKRQDPATIASETSALRDADAIYVLRPDLLSNTGWEAIERWLAGGGLAWFVPPAEPGPAIWATKLAETFELGWSAGGDPVEHDPAVGLKTDIQAPLELGRLSADLPDLLRAIEIDRRIPIDRESLNGQTDVLLETVGGEPVLIGATVPNGGGRILLGAVAFDVSWSNLPTKPLFVPLQHEVLRAAIDLLQPDHAYQPGERPALGEAFERVSALRAPDGSNVLLVTTRDTPESPEVTRPIRPLEEPGLYTAPSAAIAVNVAPEAGNTTTTDKAMLDAWLNTIGEWQALDRAEPGEIFAQQAEQTDWSWPLLWIVLALAVIEVFLARWVSHASSAHRTDSVADLAATPRRAGA